MSINPATSYNSFTALSAALQQMERAAAARQATNAAPGKQVERIRPQVIAQPQAVTPPEGGFRMDAPRGTYVNLKA